MSASALEHRTRTRTISILLVVALVAVAAIPLAALWKAFGPKASTAPDFTLIDQNGRPFTLSALHGHPVVLFFGYTHCPDVCPTTLAHIARAVRTPGVPNDVHVAFITVDPQRDSPALLRRYIALFDPRFIGLTGSLNQLDPVYSAYHTWRQAIPAGSNKGDYLMAHGTSVYYIGRDGALRGIGDWNDDTASIAHDLITWQ
jgi:protein SCO1/2